MGQPGARSHVGAGAQTDGPHSAVFSWPWPGSCIKCEASGTRNCSLWDAVTTGLNPTHYTLAVALKTFHNQVSRGKRSKVFWASGVGSLLLSFLPPDYLPGPCFPSPLPYPSAYVFPSFHPSFLPGILLPHFPKFLSLLVHLSSFMCSILFCLLLLFF